MGTVMKLKAPRAAGASEIMTFSHAVSSYRNRCCTAHEAFQPDCRTTYERSRRAGTSFADLGERKVVRAKRGSIQEQFLCAYTVDVMTGGGFEVWRAGCCQLRNRSRTHRKTELSVGTMYHLITDPCSTAATLLR